MEERGTMEDEDFMEIRTCAATVIIVNKRRRRRLARQRKVWSRQWLLDRNTHRSMLNYVDYELYTR